MHEMFALNAFGFTRGHSVKICKPHASNCTRQSAFAVCATNGWNGLPADVKLPSVDAFKERLDSHWEPFWYTIHDTDLYMAQLHCQWEWALQAT